MPINCEMPQGSILRPLLVILYIDDVIRAFHLAETIMFADDTNLFVTDLQPACVMYSSIRSLLQNCSSTMFVLNSYIHAHFTRMNVHSID